MSWISVDETGAITVRDPYEETEEVLTLPAGIGIIAKQPSFQRYGAGDGFFNVYLAGKWSLPMVRSYGGIYRTGMDAPTSAPTLALGSATGMTGSLIARYTRAQYVAGKKLAESNPSPASCTVVFTDDKPVFSGLPTTPDDRTTHLNLYLSVNGSLSFKAASVILGTTTETITLTTTELFQQETLPIKFTADGMEEDDVLARGRPPYATVILRWHNRLWYVDPTRPGVVFSGLNELEAVNESEDLSFFPTLGGEYVLSLGYLDDELILFCEDIAYAITGFGPSSFRMRVVNEGTRFIGPMSPQTIQGIIFFASDQGICNYSGGGGNAFRNVMARSMRNAWIADYASDPAAFETGCSANDMIFGDYVFIPARTPTLGYRGYYRPMTEDGEAEPWWFYGDRRIRGVRALGQLFLPDTSRGLIAYGECDGQVRRDDPTDATDDGDTYNKRMTIRHKHFFMGDQAGDAAHGRAYTNFNWFGKLTGQTAEANFYAGDDTAIDTTPTKSIDIEPMPDTGQPVQPTSYSKSLEEVAGKGVSVEIAMDNPSSSGVEHRGFAIDFIDTGSGGQG